MVAAPAVFAASDTQMDHTANMQMTDDAAQTASMPTEGGQAAFAAIHEIVVILKADPDTDWSKVDFEKLRQHLIDMDNVTLRARVATEDIDGGAIFTATSDDPRVIRSIRNMVVAHAATMSGVDDTEMTAEKIDNGARLTVTGPNPELIRGLGFIGSMAEGGHHQAHHLALALGGTPH
jgi:hypothetical protein